MSPTKQTASLAVEPLPQLFQLSDHLRTEPLDLLTPLVVIHDADGSRDTPRVDPALTRADTAVSVYLNLPRLSTLGQEWRGYYVFGRIQ